MQILTTGHWSGILVLVSRSEKSRIVLDDYESGYDALLTKSGTVTMEISAIKSSGY